MRMRRQPLHCQAQPVRHIVRRLAESGIAIDLDPTDALARPGKRTIRPYQLGLAPSRKREPVRHRRRLAMPVEHPHREQRPRRPYRQPVRRAARSQVQRHSQRTRDHRNPGRLLDPRPRRRNQVRDQPVLARPRNPQIVLGLGQPDGLPRRRRQHRHDNGFCLLNAHRQ